MNAMSDLRLRFLAPTALWLLAELMRGRWFTGFPWGAGGYAHVDSWLASLAPWVGVYGVGAVAAALAMRLALGVARWQAWRDTAAVLALCNGRLTVTDLARDSKLPLPDVARALSRLWVRGTGSRRAS